MRNLFAALVATTLAVLCVSAQDAEDSTVSVSAYGTAATQVIDGVAEDLDVRLQVSDELRDAYSDTPLWLICEDARAEDVLGVLGRQMEVRLEWNPADGLLTAYEYGEPGGSLKGYDVSVLAGRYVEYINSYGASRRRADKPKSAARRWAELAGDTICPEAEISVVGDRVLITDVKSNHRRVREFLSLMVGEGGGESAGLVTEREVIEKLKETEIELEVRQRPLGSAFAEICGMADVPCFIELEVAGHYTEEHIDASFDGQNAYDALRKLVSDHGEYDDVIGVYNGFAFATYDEDRLFNSYRVIDVSELLKKLDTAYQRQRTAQNKQDGYQGSLREDGGVDVILEALVDQLDANGHSASCRAFGSRLIVFGRSEVVDAALEILTEMGWESPETEDDE